MDSPCTNIFVSALTCVKSHTYVATAVVVVASILFLRKRLFKPKLDQPIVKSPVLNKPYLFQFATVMGFNPSPYCLKVETFLKLAGVEYKAINSFFNLDKFSRHKFPVIQYNQEIVQDSSNIVAYLDRVLGKNTDAGLTKEEEMLTTCFKSLVEAELGPIVVYFRWANDAGWAKWSAEAFKSMHPLLKLIGVPRMARNNTIEQLRASGIGRIPEQEILDKARSILKALDTQLGKSKFLLGDKFHLVDLSVYGVLAQIILFPMDTPLQALALQFDRLVSYCKNIRDLVESKQAPSSSK